MRVIVLGVVTIVVAGIAGVAFTSAPGGVYKLATAGDHPVPLALGGGIIPGEGATLTGAELQLRSNGQFTARVEIAWTDSGTIRLETKASGRWRAGNGRVILNYRTVRPPGWCPVGACADTAGADTARVTTAGLELDRFAGLGPTSLGPGALLQFRRAGGRPPR